MLTEYSVMRFGTMLYAETYLCIETVRTADTNCTEQSEMLASLKVQKSRRSAELDGKSDCHHGVHAAAMCLFLTELLGLHKQTVVSYTPDMYSHNRC